MIKGEDFITDGDKLVDLFKLSKEEFLKSYSYLTEEDYDLTVNKIKEFSDKPDAEASRDFGYYYVQTESDLITIPETHFIAFNGIGVRRGDIKTIAKLGAGRTLISYQDPTSGLSVSVEVNTKFEDVLKFINSGGIL